ncbi:hypothetical protein [Parabacteroides sp. Marseille-P3160]|uniref:hypothetical protein n=1 Tax=Parabacteroides sp. Marseille-P3160 TaxID=1917887 RepID=UPI00111B6610|nr:hypothetical protein [Parabacteroides sp. Marseille-P3160]
MKKLILLLSLLLIVLLSLFVYGRLSENPLDRQVRLAGMVTQKEGNFKFSMSKTLSRSERKELITRTKECITRSLELIHEPPFDDAIHFVLVPTRNDMKNLLGTGIGGTAFPKDYESYPEGARPDVNLIYAVHGGKHNALGHEVMHMVAFLKWGQTHDFSPWFEEGLATLSSPETEDCDGYTFEQRYVYFLQNGKLIPPDSTMNFYQKGDSLIQRKIFYNQAAYMVGYLIDNYGIGNFKQLWQNGMGDFEKIYGIPFENCIRKINDELNKKYSEPINFSREAFTENCIK